MDVDALIIFVDIRLFTLWAENVEVSANLNGFVQGFTTILRRHFRPRTYLLKPLGDGAMLVRELEGDMDADATAKLLDEVLDTAQTVGAAFQEHCRRFAQRIGHETKLDLGWGIVRGKVKRLTRDYVGSNVNKAARLCDRARPFGIVIDQDDFPKLPSPKHYALYAQVRKLKGLGEVRVWVTKEIGSEFLTRETLRQQPEVHIAGTCVNLQNKRKPLLLLARRAPSRDLFPDKIEGCGGQLASNETFVEGVQRHFRLEMGIQVNVFEDVHCFYEIRERNRPLIPGIRFLCAQVDEAAPRSANHSQVWWASEAEFRALPEHEFVGGMKHEVIQLLERLRQRG